MRNAFAEELTRLEDQVSTMAQLVTESIVVAGRALLEPDLRAAESVIAADLQIDKHHSDLDERCVSLLLLQAPVATDLRVVVATLRMGSSLERMGDLAGHVARLTRMRFPGEVVPEELRDDVSLMLQSARKMASLASRLMTSRDLSMVSLIMTEDDVLDELHRGLFRKIEALDGQITAEQIMDMALLNRHLERFGDHATKLARRVAFIVTGGGERALNEWLDEAN